MTFRYSCECVRAEPQQEDGVQAQLCFTLHPETGQESRLLRPQPALEKRGKCGKDTMPQALTAVLSHAHTTTHVPHNHVLSY